MITYEAKYRRYGSKGWAASARYGAGSVLAAKALAVAGMPAPYHEPECLLIVSEDGEVIARHQIVQYGLATDRQGKWKEIDLPAATVQARGYRVVARYESARGWCGGPSQDTCDRCKSGIKKVVVVEDRYGRQQHVGADCAKRMGMR